MSSNREFQAVFEGIEDILSDPNESLERRALAIQWRDRLTKGSPPGVHGSWDAAMTPTALRPASSGDRFLGTLGAEEGWGRG